MIVANNSKAENARVFFSIGVEPVSMMLADSGPIDELTVVGEIWIRSYKIRGCESAAPYSQLTDSTELEMYLPSVKSSVGRARTQRKLGSVCEQSFMV